MKFDETAVFKATVVTLFFFLAAVLLCFVIWTILVVPWLIFVYLAMTVWGYAYFNFATDKSEDDQDED